MTDHAYYIHAVAHHLNSAGFHVLSVGGHDWEPRGGIVRLGAQDGWDDYRYAGANLLWDERDGWRLHWGGLTRDLSVPLLASPRRVAASVGHELGQVALPVEGRDVDVRAESGTPEFDAALAAYVKEDA